MDCGEEWGWRARWLEEPSPEAPGIERTTWREEKEEALAEQQVSSATATFLLERIARSDETPARKCSSLGDPGVQQKADFKINVPLEARYDPAHDESLNKGAVGGD